jgi:hypothetical protein
MQKNTRLPGIIVGAIIVFMVTVVCSTSNIPLLGTPEQAATPTAPGLNEWVDGHYFSIRVAEVRTSTDLNGKTPREDRFVLVNVEWKANSLSVKHSMSGVDYELVDQDGETYPIAGMIYESDTFDSFSDNAEFQKGKWRVSTVTGTHSDTYRLVFDVPDSAQGLQLWYGDLPLINLDIE